MKVNFMRYLKNPECVRTRNKSNPYNENNQTIYR